jgi:hypothetical protein
MQRLEGGYLLGSRYCETDRLSEEAWRLFGARPSGWARVQAICDFVHNHVVFGYEHSRPTRTAAETYAEGRGVCRDFAHLAIALCRCDEHPGALLLGLYQRCRRAAALRADGLRGMDRGVARRRLARLRPAQQRPRIGRVLIARGRDAADAPLTLTFGPNTLLDGTGDGLNETRLLRRIKPKSQGRAATRLRPCAISCACAP